jgi:hydrogenase nickel incorporation protein HypA/HybF
LIEILRDFRRSFKLHEYSIVQDLLSRCEETVKKHDVTKVVKVITKIGVLSGVEPYLLKVAFDTFKEGTVCSDATLQIDIQKVVIECTKCKEQFTIDGIVFFCPKCGGLNTKIIDGKDMYLMSLEMEQIIEESSSDD